MSYRAAWSLLIVMLFSLTSWADEPASTPTEPAAPPPVASAPSATAGSTCEEVSRQSESVCGNYLRSAAEQSPQRKFQGSTVDGLERVNHELDAALERSFRHASECVKMATACTSQCQPGSPQNGACHKQLAQAKDKHRRFRDAARKSQETNNEVRTSTREQSHDRDPREVSEASAPHDSHTSTNVPAPSTPPTAVHDVKLPETKPPDKTTPDKASSDKTAEERREERRQRRAEERKQERIEALSKAFMALNPQTAPSQALQERSSAAVPPITQKTVAAVAKPSEEEEDLGRAGFNALADKNMAARKALAVAMGINAHQLPGVTARKSNVASGPSAALNFAGGRFEHSLNDTTLDPPVEISPPSNLPQNFRISTPSGSGGASPAPSATMASLNPAKLNLTRRRPSAGEDESSHRGPAGLDTPPEIRPQAADIWAVMSTAFRSRCAEGRLMDCASHLPPP